MVKPGVPVRVDLGHVAREALGVLDPSVTVARVVQVGTVLEVAVAVPVGTHMRTHNNVVVEHDLAKRVPPPVLVDLVQPTEKGHLGKHPESR